MPPLPRQPDHSHPDSTDHQIIRDLGFSGILVVKIVSAIIGSYHIFIR
jgi:hypothetical protein